MCFKGELKTQEITWLKLLWTSFHKPHKRLDVLVPQRQVDGSDASFYSRARVQAYAQDSQDMIIWGEGMGLCCLGHGHAYSFIVSFTWRGVAWKTQMDVEVVIAFDKFAG